MGSGPSSCKWDFVIGFRAHMMELNFICFVIAYFVPQVLKTLEFRKKFICLIFA